MQDLDILRAKLGDKAKRIEQIGGQVLIHGDCLGNGKLTEAQAREAKLRLAAGESAPEIAKDYGVKRGTIYNIKYRKAWSWLDEN